MGERAAENKDGGNDPDDRSDRHIQHAFVNRMIACNSIVRSFDDIVSDCVM